MKPMRWRDGVSHLGAQVVPFLNHLLGLPSRSVLYIAGAGFDPRATHLAARISETPATRRGIFVREERPDPQAELVARADANEALLAAAFPNHEVLNVNVFDAQHAVVGGAAIVAEIRSRLLPAGALDGITDIVVDLSALSLGISFPIVGLLFQILEAKAGPNLHLVAATGGPEMEAAIVAEHAENYQNPHGFKGTRPGADAVRLWIPQLTNPKQTAFSTLFEELHPRETCPVFPFPSRDPRGVEKLLDQFASELRDEWLVDTRHMLLAAEDDPLDLYRTVSRIHLARHEIYDRAGQPAETVLSPIGSKAMAIGALLVALEHKLPVAYVEARRYEPPACGFSDQQDEPRFVHVWVLGEVYPAPVPAPLPAC